MREASLGYKHRIYFYMPVSGPSLITGCPCALSQAGCLGLLTVEKRMLWQECCGVNSGEHSSQCWVIAGVAQPVEEIKWLLSVTWLHTICFHIKWLHPTGSGLNARSQTWNAGDINVHASSCSFTCYSGHAISSVERASITSVTHQSCPVTATHCWVGGWCFPGGVQPIMCRSGGITVCCLTQLLWFHLFYPASRNYIFWDV